ncbi:hypothetical protein DFH09DRAFT_1086407 [Mycena vulgaris]|nr:hypothetical protein DFH09DRAFT_1086407 [Mycena vulgaris]
MVHPQYMAQLKTDDDGNLMVAQGLEKRKLGGNEGGLLKDGKSRKTRVTASATWFPRLGAGNARRRQGGGDWMAINAKAQGWNALGELRRGELASQGAECGQVGCISADAESMRTHSAKLEPLVLLLFLGDDRISWGYHTAGTDKNREIGVTAKSDVEKGTLLRGGHRAQRVDGRPTAGKNPWRG